MKTRLLPIILSLILVTVLGVAAGCAAPPEEVGVAALQKQVADLQKEVAAKDAQIAQMVAKPEPITWKMSSAWPAGNPLQHQAELFVNKVNEMAAGRLVIDSYAAGELVGAMEYLDATSTGAIDAAHGCPFYMVGKDVSAPLFGSIPLGLEASPYLAWFYEGGGLELMREMYARHGLIAVGPCGILPPESLGWAHKPLRAVDDFKGLNYREGGFWGEILTELGVSVQMLPTSEVYGALERKVLDAAGYSTTGIDRVIGIHEICHYLMVPGIHQPATILELVVNPDSWAALPDDLKETVEVAAEATTLTGLSFQLKVDAEALVFFEDYGTEIVRVSPGMVAEMTALTDAFLNKKAAEDPFFDKVLKSFRAWRAIYDPYYEEMSPVFAE